MSPLPFLRLHDDPGLGEDWAKVLAGLPHAEGWPDHRVDLELLAPAEQLGGLLVDRALDGHPLAAEAAIVGHEADLEELPAFLELEVCLRTWLSLSLRHCCDTFLHHSVNGASSAIFSHIATV